MSQDLSSVLCERCGVPAGMASSIAPFGNNKGARITDALRANGLIGSALANSNHSRNLSRARTELVSASHSSEASPCEEVPANTSHYRSQFGRAFYNGRLA